MFMYMRTCGGGTCRAIDQPSVLSLGNYLPCFLETGSLTGWDVTLTVQASFLSSEHGCGWGIHLFMPTHPAFCKGVKT